MVAPALVPASAPVAKTAARWRIAVDGAFNPASAGSAAVTSTDAAWLQVFGIMDFSPGTIDWTEQDDTDYDGVDASGIVWASSVTTGAGWTLGGTVKLAAYGGARDPGAAWLEDKSDSHTLVHVLWYDRFGSKAYHGYGFVKFTIAGGAPTAISTATFEIKGQGVRTSIANPIAISTIPDATTAAPTTGPAGTTVTLTGTNLSNVTAIAFGATSAVVIPVSDTSVKTVVPAGGTAGSQPIKVTNAFGDDSSLVAFTKS